MQITAIAQAIAQIQFDPGFQLATIFFSTHERGIRRGSQKFTSTEVEPVMVCMQNPDELGVNTQRGWDNDDEYSCASSRTGGGFSS
jgi:hypothetical protein